ncbi:MBL fold metallo-hydrolase, partial [Dysosmobacter welbionis]
MDRCINRIQNLHSLDTGVNLHYRLKAALHSQGRGAGSRTGDLDHIGLGVRAHGSSELHVDGGASARVVNRIDLALIQGETCAAGEASHSGRCYGSHSGGSVGLGEGDPVGASNVVGDGHSHLKVNAGLTRSGDRHILHNEVAQRSVVRNSHASALNGNIQLRDHITLILSDLTAEVIGVGVALQSVHQLLGGHVGSHLIIGVLV